MPLDLALPAPDLRDLADAYCFVGDDGRSPGGRPIRVPPIAACVLGLQLARPVRTEFPSGAPIACLTGFQDVVRHYVPAGETNTVLVMLKPWGAVRLFPSVGSATVRDSLDLGGILGDREVAALRASLAAAPGRAAMAAEIDRWLRRRRDRVRVPDEAGRLAFASTALAESGGRVDGVAARLGISARQLERLFRTHLGLTPKGLAGLHRLQASVRSALTGTGDPLDGFADQAHQIRVWRAHLGTTPGRVRRDGTSDLAAAFLARYGARVPYAHYL